MDCRTFERNLEDYLEGGLDFAGRFGMERHAQQCFSCDKTVSDAQKLSRMARNLKRVAAPADFEAAVLARIQKEGLARRPAWYWRLPVFWNDRWSWRPVALGIMALALLGLGALISTRWVKVESDGSVRLARKDSEGSSAPRMNPAVDPGSTRLESTDLEEASNQQKPFPSDAVLPADGSGLSIYADPAAGTGYVEYLVPGTGNRQIIMRLPKTIWMRYGQPTEEYYIRNVSH